MTWTTYPITDTHFDAYANATFLRGSLSAQMSMPLALNFLTGASHCEGLPASWSLKILKILARISHLKVRPFWAIGLEPLLNHPNVILAALNRC